jgi:hypothetical protein
VIVEMPPRHGKSEGTSRRLPAFLFGAAPAARVVLACHTADLAQEMSRDVRNVLDGDAYRAVFPAAGLTKGRRDRERADLFDVAGGGSFKAVGIGGGLSGRGFTHGVIDDYVKDREEANSPAHRERVWRWYTSVFHTRQAKDAGILITATRWHEDDLIGRLKRKVAAGESGAVRRRHPPGPGHRPPAPGATRESPARRSGRGSGRRPSGSSGGCSSRATSTPSTSRTRGPRAAPSGTPRASRSRSGSTTGRGPTT